MSKFNKITHRSAKGKIIDLAALMATHSSQKALGNIPMNAQGDLLDSSGNIIRRRSQIVQDYYNQDNGNVKKVSLKPLGQENFDTPEEALKKLTGSSTIIPDSPSNILPRKGRKIVDTDSKE